MPQERLQIPPTKRTPWIDLEEGRIFIMGRSIIENPSIFFEPLYNWIGRYINENPPDTVIELGFEYINTGSIKWLYLVLRELSGTPNLSEFARINWYYEQGDEDMGELGFILRSLMDCSFTIVEVESMDNILYKSLLSRTGEYTDPE